MTIAISRAIPIFRILSLEKAREFHGEFLGCKVDWEHRIEPEAATRVSRDGPTFYLSKHHGTRGPVAFVWVAGVRELHRRIERQEISLQPARSAGAGRGMMELTVAALFSNRITSVSRPRKRPHETAFLNA